MTESTEKEIAVKKPGAVATIAEPRFSDSEIAESNIDNQSSLPDLASSKEHSVPLNIEYWSPQAEGEEKRVYVYGIQYHEVPDMKTGELKILECVVFIERIDDKLMRFISASKVLVGNIAVAIKRGDIIPQSTLTPVSIKFLGQKKNRTNSQLSSRWQITPLIVSD